MSPNFEIENDVPIPEKRKVDYHPYPFLDKMEVGQSVWIPSDYRRQETVQTAVRQHGVRSGKEFTVRKENRRDGNGCRVWRVL